MSRKSYTDTSRSLFKFHPMSGQREGDRVEVPMHQTEENQEVNCSPLNPYVPVWIGYKCSPSAINGGSTEGGLLEEHLDLSETNVSHMIEVQKLQ